MSDILTDRQAAILACMARGLSVTATADQLAVGRFTVRRERIAILRALQATNGEHAIAKAIALGVLEVRDAA